MSPAAQRQGPGPNGIGSAPIDPEAEPLRSAPSAVTGRDEEAFYAQSATLERLRQNEQNLGYLGRFFGADACAPTNIAGFVVVASLTILSLSFFLAGSSEMVEARKWLFSLITSALGFIFGAASRR